MTRTHAQVTTIRASLRGGHGLRARVARAGDRWLVVTAFPEQVG